MSGKTVGSLFALALLASFVAVAAARDLRTFSEDFGMR